MLECTAKLHCSHASTCADNTCCLHVAAAHFWAAACVQYCGNISCSSRRATQRLCLCVSAVLLVLLVVCVLKFCHAGVEWPSSARTVECTVSLLVDFGHPAKSECLAQDRNLCLHSAMAAGVEHLTAILCGHDIGDLSIFQTHTVSRYSISSLNNPCLPTYTLH